MGGANKSTFLRRVGLTKAEFDELLSGEKLLDEVRFYKLLECCRDFDYSGLMGQRPEWFIETPNWELVGLVEHTITLRKMSGGEIAGIQGIIKTPVAIIDDPDIYIEEGDCLTRILKEGQEECLYVEGVISNKYQTGVPAYILTVRRCNQIMGNKKGNITVTGNNNNITQGNNSGININASDDTIEEIFSGFLKFVKGVVSRMFGC